MILTAAMDGLLAGLLLWLAWRLLRVDDLFQAGVQFIVFGLLLAVTWLRLDAPDVALAEAAIGAGVTGALYLNTLARMETHPADEEPRAGPRTETARRLAGLVAGLLALLMVVLMGRLLLGAPPSAPPLPDTGKLDNPVTAVLLDVRSYDTLLETAVLVEALMGVWILGRPLATAAHPAPEVLRGLVRLLVPVMVVVAGALLWNGSTATGGAFQAAAVLAAAGILLRLGGFPLPLLHHPRPRAALAVLGTAFFLAVGLGVMGATGSFLAYPPPWQGWLVLAIETAATLSLAAVLVVLFEATSPPARDGEATP
ncbi:hydrogenase subunit MbhD domain-containing protein [Thiohalorhabdus sp. Cl-TMA]|uniref:Hydrogenase subunit MbhD domain-containing protein n=1 Tax=Thiohalorhabdus methylotrophus TaxID=3242694 RepID=A0ABV4TR85_9GAMM